MDTNRREDRWTSVNDKRHQNPSAILCPWCDFVPLVDNPLNWFHVSVVGEGRAWRFLERLCVSEGRT